LKRLDDIRAELARTVKFICQPNQYRLYTAPEHFILPSICDSLMNARATGEGAKAFEIGVAAMP